MPASIVDEKVLVVEGYDDEWFLKALIQYERVTGIYVFNTRGKTSLRDELKALSSTPGFDRVTSLGIMRDADNSAATALQSVRGALQNAGLPAPNAVLVPAGIRPRVTVMLMPDGANPGALEDLCLSAISTHPAMACVQDYFRCLARQGIPSPTKESKAKAAVYLAAMPELKRLGEAAHAGYWPWQANEFNSLKLFLHAL
jgi:hypothetical protein